MPHQARRDGGEIRIVVAEQHLRIDRVVDLHERAFRAEHQVERRHRLRLGQLRVGHQPVGECGLAEGHDLPELLAAAGQAALEDGDHAESASVMGDFSRAADQRRVWSRS